MAAYVQYQIEQAGGEPEQVFAASAYESVYRATDGVPRLIDQVCDHALILAELGDCRGQRRSHRRGLERPATIAATLAKRGTPERGRQVGCRVRSVGRAGSGTHGNSVSARRGNSPNPAGRRADWSTSSSSWPIWTRIFSRPGRLGPKWNSLLHNRRRPFGNEFDEEEVVIDRYVSLEADLFAERPMVASREGDELWHC